MLNLYKEEFAVVTKCPHLLGALCMYFYIIFYNFYIFLIFQNVENKISAELVTRTYVKNSSFKVRLYIILAEGPGVARGKKNFEKKI